MIKKIGLSIKNHKIITGIVLILLLGGGYYTYQKFTQEESAVRYITQPVERGTLILTIGGTGQIASARQLDLTTSVSGEVASVNVAIGQEVYAGDVLLTLDDKDARKAVRDAILNLQSAQLAQEELKATSDPNLVNSLDQAYASSYNTLADAFIDLATIVTTLDDILYNASYLEDDVMGTYDAKTQDYKNSAQAQYQKALTAYNQDLEKYRALSRASSSESIALVLSQTADTLKLTGEAVKKTDILLERIDDQIDAEDRPASLVSNENSLDTYTGQVNTHLQSITTKRDAVQALKFDFKAQEITLQQKNNALLDAREDLVDYQMTAPIDGMVAAISVQEKDPVSASSAAVTLVSKEMLAEISLNEVDVAQVQVGQKATFTFDALPDLTITGKVVEVEMLGTVEQGVVTYTVKLSLDVTDDRLKPGMSVSANITTEIKQNVLLVPNAALEQQGESPFVKVMRDGSPQGQEVQTGLANDTQTEILNGLNEGDEVITQTIESGSTPTDNSTNQSIFPTQMGPRGR